VVDQNTLYTLRGLGRDGIQETWKQLEPFVQRPKGTRGDKERYATLTRCSLNHLLDYETRTKGYERVSPSNQGDLVLNGDSCAFTRGRDGGVDEATLTLCWGCSFFRKRRTHRERVNVPLSRKS